MNRKALLIGINKYQTLGKLSFARQDAEAFAETLCSHYGFSSHDINLMTCQAEGAGAAFSRYVELAISDLVEYKDLDLLVFGFWGHGFAPEAGKRYLCGLDTIVDDLERTAVSMDLIKAKLSQVGAENTLLILDCCQNKPTGRSVEAETLSCGEEAELSSLARDIQTARREESKLTVPTVAVLNSCREGQRAYEWKQREHGIFTAHLLDQMTTGISSVAQLASSIFDPVTQTAMNLHRQKQTPFVIIEGKGDIPLIGAGTPNKSKKANSAHKKKQVTKARSSNKSIVVSKKSHEAPSNLQPKKPRVASTKGSNDSRTKAKGVSKKPASNISNKNNKVDLTGNAIDSRFICPVCGKPSDADGGSLCKTCNAFIHKDCQKCVKTRKSVDWMFLAAGFCTRVYTYACPICGTVIRKEKVG